jgi:hypothetical protein
LFFLNFSPVSSSLKLIGLCSKIHYKS